MPVRLQFGRNTSGEAEIARGALASAEAGMSPTRRTSSQRVVHRSAKSEIVEAGVAGSLHLWHDAAVPTLDHWPNQSKAHQPSRLESPRPIRRVLGPQSPRGDLRGNRMGSAGIRAPVHVEPNGALLDRFSQWPSLARTARRQPPTANVRGSCLVLSCWIPPSRSEVVPSQLRMGGRDSGKTVDRPRWPAQRAIRQGPLV